MMKVKCCRFLWWKWNARWSHVLLLLGFSEFVFNSMRILTKGKKYLQGTASFWKSTFFSSESVAIESRPKESFQMLWKYTHLVDKAKLLYKHFWAFESWLIFFECIWNFTSPTYVCMYTYNRNCVACLRIQEPILRLWNLQLKRQRSSRLDRFSK
jgi:hypothetical protein